MRILTLDAALARCSAAVIQGGAVLAARLEDGTRGQAAALPPMVRQVLDESGVAAARLDLVAVTVGPGSFTGIRAALSLAQGIGLATGIPMVGVTVPEALAESLPSLEGRELWVTIDSRRGWIFLARAGGLSSLALESLPAPGGPVALAGDAAATVAARLVAGGVDAVPTPARLPEPLPIAAAALRRWRRELPPLPLRPLYIDPPAARPAAGLRPAPR